MGKVSCPINLGDTTMKVTMINGKVVEANVFDYVAQI